MQILLLHRCPRTAVRRFKSKKLPGKLLVEALQLLSTALRKHGVEDDVLYRSHNSNHPCALWVASGKRPFTWTLAYARECYTLFNLYVRKRCKKCRGFQGAAHASLRQLEHIEALAAGDGESLPSFLQKETLPDDFYDQLRLVRSRQSKNAVAKAGDVVEATTGLPEGCQHCALAIESSYMQSCLRLDEKGLVDGISTYRAYHEARVPVPDPISAEWREVENDVRVPLHACACGRQV